MRLGAWEEEKQREQEVGSGIVGVETEAEALAGRLLGRGKSTSLCLSVDSKAIP